MAPPITLFTGQWADLPFEELCGLAAGWGYDGLEIACWGDHLDVRRVPRAQIANLPQPSRSTTWSTQFTSASMSAGSIAGNMATRSWLRPSLR